MAIEWLAGNRLRGTTAERPSASLQSPSVGGWVEVGRTTLGANAGNIAVDSLSDKKYYMVLADLDGSATRELCRLNSDSGTNYAHRYTSNGASDGTATNATKVELQGIYNTTDERFKVFYIANKSDKEKLVISQSVNMNGSGAGNTPNRYEVVGKWTNTSNAISKIDLVSWGSSNVGPSGDWQSGSEVVVLGWDPSDTHTTNFWEELADTTFTSSGVSAQTFTAKKYILCQFWFTSDASGNGQYFQLGDTGGIDTGSTYARRFSINGGADSTSANQSKIYFAPQTGAVTHFVNMFIVNNASNEKLVIVHATTNNGAGAGNAPQRRETVGKWVETTNQCDRITIATDAGTFTGGQLKVWGAD